MDISLEKYIERLMGILKRKKLLLQEMLELTGKQSNALTEDTIDDLQELVDQKQLKIDDINSLDEEFEVYFNRLKTSQKISRLDELDITGIAAAKELKAVTGEILELIKAIGELEKSNSEKSKELLSHLGDELKKINQGKKTNNAYAPIKVKPPSYFIDKKK